MDIKQDQPESEKETTRKGHQQGFETGPQRFRIAIVRDQRPRTEGGHLPEKIELQQVRGESDADHGGDEEQQPGVMAGLALSAGMLPVARAEIGGGVEHDQKAEQYDHQQQEQGETVEEETEEALPEIALQPSPGQGQALPAPLGFGQEQPEEAEHHPPRRPHGALVGMPCGQERTEHSSDEGQEEQEDHAGHRAFPFRCGAAGSARSAQRRPRIMPLPIRPAGPDRRGAEPDR